MDTSIHRDPIMGAIARHNEAWSAMQEASNRPGFLGAELAMYAALDTVMATPSASRAGAAALARHLHWFIATEGITPDPDDGMSCIIVARASDLTLLLEQG